MGFEEIIRATAYFSILGIMAVWELMAPRRPLTMSKFCRWGGNLTIGILNTAIARVFFVGGVAGTAVIALEQSWGLLNWVEWPVWLELGLALLALDLIIYLQHYMFHLVPILWRFHMMHHSDLDLDVTSGVRFHPVEIVLSTILKAASVIFLGISPLAVIVFEIVLNSTALFNHSNVQIPLSLDRVLRWAIVTPDMHRIHHSVDPQETNSNYGFNIPWWDRLFGTYCPEPKLGQLGMKIGLEHLVPPVCMNLLRMLQFPFVTTLGRYVSNRANGPEA